MFCWISAFVSTARPVRFSERNPFASKRMSYVPTGTLGKMKSPCSSAVTFVSRHRAENSPGKRDESQRKRDSVPHSPGAQNGRGGERENGVNHSFHQGWITSN